MTDVAINSEDLSAEEKTSLDSYIKNGCPGLVKAADVDTFKWFELYMNGKTYSEIADITKQRKDLIIFISTRSKWHEKKMSYYEDIAANITKKIAKSKIDSINTVTSIQAALGKYIGSKMDEYISTNNPEIIEKLDTKILSQYYKSIEIVESVLPSQGKGDPKSPNVNINVGNATVKQNQDGDIEINSESDILKIMADFKKSNIVK